MGKQTSTYPPPEQRERWQERADEMGMSLSQFLAAMTEAGMKKFEREVEPDFTNAELREQRAELLDELNAERERNRRLEEQVYRGEPRTIVEFVEENPGAEYHEILHHLQNTAGSRLTNHLDTLVVDGKLETNDEGQHFVVHEEVDTDEDE